MMQTFLSRMGDFFSGLLPPAEPPDDKDSPADTVREAAHRDGEDRLPERDESYYWAMHAHW